jgi:hypothetical protein
LRGKTIHFKGQMIESLASQRHPDPGRQQASRALGTAVGILVGWRRYTTYAAFRELLSAGERHEVPLFQLASALVALTSAADSGTTGVATARLAAEKEWGLT